MLRAPRLSCMRRMMGRYQGIGSPSTAELLDVTGQIPITQLLSRHRVRWLGHAAASPRPQWSICCMQTLSRGAPGCPHYTWMDGAMQDLSTLGPRLQLDLLRSWRWTGNCGGGCQPVLALLVLIDTGLLSFSFSHQGFSSSSLSVF